MKFRGVLIFIAALAVLFGIMFMLQEDEVQPLPAVEQLPEDVIPEEEPTQYLYGLPVDSFQVTQSEIKKNQYLGTILNGLGVPAQTIDQIVKTAKPIFDFRKIRPGKPYTAFVTADSNAQLAYFVYQPYKTEFVVVDLTDSVHVYMGEKEVVTKIRKASGVITSSLSKTMSDQHLSPNLSVRLADLYAWTIDFYRIQKGDYFQVIFEEQYVDSERIGAGRILAANFNSYGQNNYAFAYDQGDGEDYFNEDAESLRRAFLQSPLKFGRLTSAYTKRRFHPVQKRYKAHLGTDYAAPTGTPIMAVGDGVVIAAKYAKYNGNYVKIRHNGTYTTQYLHMSRIGKGIKPGVRVKQGQTIGYVGSTGLATGPHVCFRFWKNGQQVDHRREKLPASKPIKKEELEPFKAHAAEWKSKLDSIEVVTPNS
jgi:murein DD-endopeptidase MepM/ murein hydrolase activator NlpD